MKPTYVGLLAAGIYIVFKMALFTMGMQHEVLVKTPWVPLMAAVIMGIFYSINQYVRSTKTYDWSTAFKRGLNVALVAAVVAGIFIYVYYRFIDVEYMPLKQVEAYNLMKDQLPKEKLNDLVESNKTAFSPGIYSVSTMFLINATGLLGSLIVAMLARVMLQRKS